MESVQRSGDFDVARIDKLASLAVVVIGLLPIVAGIAASPEHQVPASWLLALLGAFIVVKGAVAVLGVRAHWRAWPALPVEMAALAVVGFIVWADLRSPVPIVVAAALLLGATMVRRRAARAQDGSGGLPETPAIETASQDAAAAEATPAASESAATAGAAAPGSNGGGTDGSPAA